MSYPDAVFRGGCVDYEKHLKKFQGFIFKKLYIFFTFGLLFRIKQKGKNKKVRR